MLAKTMMPKTQGARTVFIILLSAAGLFLLISIGATVWSQAGDEGWVAKAVIAFASWALTVPLVLASVIWALISAFSSRGGDSAGRETTTPPAH
ncbi:MAG TPA: hypothetical protein K8U86_01135 [Brevibacterium ravenspurgense]|nr:hypothetical protein [Brevibacterium ravenspurgense]